MRKALAFIAFVVGSFAIYTSNAQALFSYDSVPNSLLAFNLIEDHRLDFDRFRGSYFTALGGGYAFAEAPNGHLASVFPIGAAIVTLPLAGIFWGAAHLGSNPVPAISSPAFEPIRLRFERTAAAAVAAISVGLCFLCARELGSTSQATVVTLVYGFATSMWSIASQALWQHGPVNLLVLAMVYTLFRAARAGNPALRTTLLIGAGVCAGLLPVTRPTAALFSLAGLLFACGTYRTRALPFAVAAAISVTPGVAWNAYFYHSLLGGYAGYAGVTPAYIFSPPRALAAFAGLLVSPSRGILIFSPVIALALGGAISAWRIRRGNAFLVALLTAAAGMIVVQYAFFNTWWGGYAYGPRYLCDIEAVAALALTYAIPASLRSYLRRGPGAAAKTAVFVLAFFFAVTVQFAGVNSGAAGSEWNAVPSSVDQYPDRVWRLADNQIERNLRAAYFRFFAWDIARSPVYTANLAAHVTRLSPSFVHVTPGSSIDATAVVENTGRSPLFGYDTGVYVGQVRIAVRISDAKQHLASEQYLYVHGASPPRMQSAAMGTLVMPRTPGAYVIECSPVLVGGGVIADPGGVFRIAIVIG